MLSLLLVGLGGTFGSLTRYVLGKKIAEKHSLLFPLHTFLINISGAFLLGFVSNIGLMNHTLLFVADGFLGAYTTFSTFMFEGFSIIRGSKKINAILYICFTVIAGISGYILGMIVANIIPK